MKALSEYPTSAAFDAITEHGSTVLLGRVLSRASLDGKGTITYVLHSFKDHEQIPNGVEAKLTYVASAYLDDEACKFINPPVAVSIAQECIAVASRFYRQTSKYLLQSPTNPTPLKPNRVKLMPNGLASVSDGVGLLKNGNVHAEKLVYRIEETPGLPS